jgi:hypothetical protein
LIASIAERQAIDAAPSARTALGAVEASNAIAERIAAAAAIRRTARRRGIRVEGRVDRRGPARVREGRPVAHRRVRARGAIASHRVGEGPGFAYSLRPGTHRAAAAEQNKRDEGKGPTPHRTDLRLEQQPLMPWLLPE